MARYITKREERSRKLTFKIFAGMFDFVGTVASTIIILMCVMLLVLLAHCIVPDFELSLGPMVDMIEDALNVK